MTTPVARRVSDQPSERRSQVPDAVVDPDAAPTYRPVPVAGLLSGDPTIRGAAVAPPSRPGVIRRHIVVGTGAPPTGRTYISGNPADRTKIGEQAGNLDTSPDKPLARRIARWMLDQKQYHHAFASNEKLRAYVDDLVRAVAATGANHLVGDEYRAEPHPFPAPNTFDNTGFGDVNKLVLQVPQERGDMHDVRAALALDPRLYVAVVVNDSRRLADAATIVEYYRGYGDRIVLLCGADLGGYAGRTRAASSTTEILFRAARAGDISGVLKQQTTGGADATYAAAYDTVLTGLHFPAQPTGIPYALINFRVSGHGITGARVASHPELDTGVSGFDQIWHAAKNSGYWPVPVGSVRPRALVDCRVPGGATFDATKHPNLIDYFTKVGPVTAAAAGAGLSKRQIEYGIFGRMATRFPTTRAIGMRSGGLDAIAYAGIPSLSIDLATEYKHGAGGLDPAHGSASSWKRAAKKELILPGRFHQVFMDALRPVAPLGDADWKGTLAEQDVARIGAALTTFFGGWGDAGTTTHALTDQPVPADAPVVLPDDVLNLMVKLRGARPGAGIPISVDLAAALGIEAF